MKEMFKDPTIVPEPTRSVGSREDRRRPSFLVGRAAFSLISCLLLGALIVLGCSREASSGSRGDDPSPSRRAMEARDEVLLKKLAAVNVRPVRAGNNGPKDAVTNVVVYGIAPIGTDRRGRMRAEMEAQQLLLLAAGAEVSLERDNLSLGASGNTRGSKVTDQTEKGGCNIVKLEASVERSLPKNTPISVSLVMRRNLSAVSNGTQVLSSILEDTKRLMRGKDVNSSDISARTLGAGENLPSLGRERGLLVLKDMKLTEGTPLGVEYEIEVKGKGHGK